MSDMQDSRNVASVQESTENTKEVNIMIPCIIISLMIYIITSWAMEISFSQRAKSGGFIIKTSYGDNITEYRNYNKLQESYLAKMLTMITCTNPRPSHPSPSIITQTIMSTYIDKNLLGVRHVIAADGCPKREAMLHST